MYIKDDKQRELLRKIKNGDKASWDEFVLMYYQQINKIMEDIKVPIDFREDILHNCIIAVMEYAYNIAIEDYDYIYARFRVIIVKQIAKSLDKIYDYKKIINGKICYQPRTYLFQVKEHNYTDYDIINEYLEYGKIKEEIIEDNPLMIRETEETVINNSLIEEYWNFVLSEPEKKQEIIVGLFPIDECFQKSISEIAKSIKTTRSYVNYEENQIRTRMARYSKFVQYLKK